MFACYIFIHFDGIPASSFTAVVGKSQLQGLGAAVDKSRQQGAECCDVTCVLTIQGAAIKKTPLRKLL